MQRSKAICSLHEIRQRQISHAMSLNFTSSPGPLSVDRFVEGDDEVDVDVEQCSDSEAHAKSRTARAPSNNSRATPQSDEERLTPEPVRKKVNFSKLAKTIILIVTFSLFSSPVFMAILEPTSNYGIMQFR